MMPRIPSVENVRQNINGFSRVTRNTLPKVSFLRFKWPLGRIVKIVHAYITSIVHQQKPM